MTQTRTLIVAMVVAIAGCGKPPPPAFTEVEGTLLLNEQPLAFAAVIFMPELANYGAEMNSSAVTDANGKFTLTQWSGQKNGAAVATHRVVVAEGPPPKEARGMDGRSQAKLAEYMKGLANRPIPDSYGNYSQTPLRVEVTPNQKLYVLKMSR